MTGGVVIKRKPIFLLIILILFFSNIVIANNDYISGQGRIRKFDWRYLTSNDKYIRFESPEEFLQEADYYVNKISQYLNKSNWLERYKRNKIRFQVSPTGISHVAGGYKNIYNPRLKIYLSEYLFKLNAAPIAHEITHLIALEYTSLSLREGLACLMQDKYGKNVSVFNYGAPIYSLSKQFHKSKYKKILTHIGKEGIPHNINLRNPQERIPFYILSYSFSKYLIDKYGIKKFMYVCEADDLLTAYENKYNKNLKELKTNWFNFLNKQDNYKYNYREWREKFFARDKKITNRL